MRQRSVHRLRRLGLAALLMALCLGGGLLGGGGNEGFLAKVESAWRALTGDGDGLQSDENSPPGGERGREKSAENIGTPNEGHTGKNPDQKAGEMDAARAALDPNALPVGIENPDGAGGQGVDRAVRKNGVWFPVYSPGKGDGSWPPPLNVVPLAIASAPAPAGRAKEAYRYQAEAVGGVPPYTWTASLDAMTASFTMDTLAGLLSGKHDEPATAGLVLTVRDATGTTDSATMPLVIRPAEDLRVTSETLPEGAPDTPYETTLAATGGLPPYTWSATAALPEGLHLAKEGGLAGVVREGGEFPILFTVTDAQNTAATRELTLRFSSGLDITTPSALPPVAPGQAAGITFEAEGGTAPYVWELTGGAFPGGLVMAEEEGVLRGTAREEGLTEFSLTVRDSLGAAFEKTFRLAVSDLLLVVPGREKAGLAWSAAAVESLLARGGLRLAGFMVERDGQLVHEGPADNFVDHGLTTGTAVNYTLLAAASDGTLQPIATRAVTILPMTTGRAVPGESGDPHADRVTLFQPLAKNGFGSALAPANVTGPPDGRGTFAPASKPAEVLSLHASRQGGGLIELEFTDNIVELGPGEDLTVFENVFFIGGDANNRFMEPATVSVALFPGDWRRLSTDVTPPAEGQPVNLRNPFYYRAGLAGRNGTTGDDPTDPARSGGDSFDLNPAAAGLSWIRYVRIQSTGDQVLRDDNGGDPIRHDADPAFNPLSGSGSSGFDLDAVTAVRY